MTDQPEDSGRGGGEYQSVRYGRGSSGAPIGIQWPLPAGHVCTDTLRGTLLFNWYSPPDRGYTTSNRTSQRRDRAQTDVYPWFVLACTALGLAMLLVGIYGGVL